MFLLLKKWEMALSTCDVFFQHVEIQSLVSGESADAGISSFLRGVAAGAVGLLVGPTLGLAPTTHLKTPPLLRPPSSECHGAQEGVEEAQNPAPSPNSAAYLLSVTPSFFTCKVGALTLAIV